MIFVFSICLTQIVLSRTKFGGHKKDLVETVPERPRVCWPEQNRRQ